MVYDAVELVSPHGAVCATGAHVVNPVQVGIVAKQLRKLDRTVRAPQSIVLHWLRGNRRRTAASFRRTVSSSSRAIATCLSTLLGSQSRPSPGSGLSVNFAPRPHPCSSAHPREQGYWQATDLSRLAPVSRFGRAINRDFVSPASRRRQAVNVMPRPSRPHTRLCQEYTRFCWDFSLC